MSKDLFDDSTMSFGEHLEVLRVHLIKALLGLTVGVLLALTCSNYVMKAIQKPVEDALAKYYSEPQGELDPSRRTWPQWFMGYPAPPKIVEVPPPPQFVTAEISLQQLWKAMHDAAPEFPAPPEKLADTKIPVQIPAEGLTGGTSAPLPVSRLPNTAIMATTMTPEEAFLVYIKVAMVTGLVLSSPWVFYQLWLFVAAGLYPHERHYIHTYLPISLGLFLGGALLCFYAVIPLVLNFLFGFNKWLNLLPQIRITEWVSFAVMLPIMFGVSFQLPLVMLFLEKINVFTVAVYREQRRMAILVISVVSMILTPSDPMSMMMMMIPLVVLYEFGILMCARQQTTAATNWS